MVQWLRPIIERFRFMVRLDYTQQKKIENEANYNNSM